MRKVCVVGLGYIGLPTALMLSSAGLEVVGTDVSYTLVSKLRCGEGTFSEKGITEKMITARNMGIRFSNTIEQSDVYIIAVPTPYMETSKKIDPQYVIQSVDAVLEVCENNSIIVIESTIAPGTIDEFVRPRVLRTMKEKGSSIHLAHAPERIIPGNMIYELINNNRTIGADDHATGEILKEIYGSFCKGKIVVTDIKTAEMAKVVENTYRDVNIAFANELAKICRSANLDVYEVIRTANMHPRVNILQPGPGVGGHCISVDPWFLVGDYPGLANIILAARKINDSMPEFTLNRAYEIMRKLSMSDLTRVGVYGITYKEDVDDIRESPTLQLIDIMKRHLANGLKSYDPMINRIIIENQFLNINDFLNEVDFIIVMVAHKQLRDNPKLLDGKVVLDTRNIEGIDKAYKL